MEDYIRSCGGEPDDKTVEDLAGKIRKRLDGILDEVATLLMYSYMSKVAVILSFR